MGPTESEPASMYGPKVKYYRIIGPGVVEGPLSSENILKWEDEYGQYEEKDTPEEIHCPGCQCRDDDECE
jgi:hypothetical protein